MNLKILAKELHLKVASVQVLRLLFIQASPSLPMTCSLLNVNTNIGPITINIPTDGQPLQCQTPDKGPGTLLCRCAHCL